MANDTTPTRQATSDDLELRGLLQLAAERQRDLAGDPTDPDPIQARTEAAFAESAARLARMATLEEHVANEQRERDREMSRRQENWRRVIGRIGKRYADCSPKNFRISDDPETAAKQRAAITTLKKLTENFPQHLESGGNVILYGPPGTGKDHLLVSLIRFAVFGGCDVAWCNGQDLFGAFRDRIDSRDSEEDLIRRYVSPEILAISDPVQPKGESSAYATSMLYRIIDGRYRQQKGTWFTVNVASAQEGEQAISGPVFDRMRDNAVTVFCNWPSYRQSNKPNFK